LKISGGFNNSNFAHAKAIRKDGEAAMKDQFDLKV